MLSELPEFFGVIVQGFGYDVVDLKFEVGNLLLANPAVIVPCVPDSDLVRFRKLKFRHVYSRRRLRLRRQVSFLTDFRFYPTEEVEWTDLGLNKLRICPICGEV